jgi:hypothetical protein
MTENPQLDETPDTRLQWAEAAAKWLFFFQRPTKRLYFSAATEVSCRRACCETLFFYFFFIQASLPGGPLVRQRKKFGWLAPTLAKIQTKGFRVGRTRLEPAWQTGTSDIASPASRRKKMPNRTNALTPATLE